VINARYLRPLDEALIHPMAERIGKIVTMEEGALPGGFGSAVLESIQEKGLAIPMLRIGIPDQLVDHATPQQSFEALGLTPDQMAVRIKQHFLLQTTGALKLEEKSPAEVSSAG
jgi:1-deoxy-D-xylulose-5-phosphate synthase